MIYQKKIAQVQESIKKDTQYTIIVRHSKNLISSSQIYFQKNINLLKPLFSKNTNFGFILIVITVIISIFLMGNSNSTKNDSKTTITLTKDQNRNLNLILNKLKTNYPNQTDQFWANIKSSFKHSIIESKDPSIILIVNDLETKDLSRKISLDILTSLRSILKSDSKSESLIIDPIDDSYLFKLIQNSETDRSKLYIDDKLDSIFKSGEKLALVNNIELLHAHTMLLFYTYGDDLTNAKYPGVLILMNLNINENIDSSLRLRFLKSSQSITKFAEDYMFNIWSKYIGDDQLRPLFTRIANNVIFLNNE